MELFIITILLFTNFLLFMTGVFTLRKNHDILNNVKKRFVELGSRVEYSDKSSQEYLSKIEDSVNKVSTKIETTNTNIEFLSKELTSIKNTISSLQNKKKT